MSGDGDRSVYPRLALVAAGAAAPYVVGCVSGLVAFTWRRLLRQPKNLSSYGKWAVVTGATDGIGRAYCDCFAEQGINVFLISRNEEKLGAVAGQLESTHGVQCKFHTIDLIEAAAFATDEKVWVDLQDAVSSLDIGILVNNAGVCYSYPERFRLLDHDMVHSIPAINIASLIKVTHLVLPGMTERKRGIIINVSTIAATRYRDGCPFSAVYTASKAFVENFSSSLAEECKDDGVQVQVHSPGFVDTKIFVQPRDFFSVSPETYSKQAVRRIGYESLSVPCAVHAFSRALVAALPRSVYMSAGRTQCGTLRGQALREIREGSRAPTGTLATAEGMTPQEEDDLINMRT